MKISDLSYVEVLNQDDAAVSVQGGEFAITATKLIDTTVNTDITFDTTINFNKTFVADVNVVSFADVTGNIASATFEIEAVGVDTLAEQDVSVIAAEGQFSSIAGSYLAAAGPFEG